MKLPFLAAETDLSLLAQFRYLLQEKLFYCFYLYILQPVGVTAVTGAITKVMNQPSLSFCPERCSRATLYSFYMPAYEFV